MSISTFERGSVNPLLIASILLGVIAAGFAGSFIWAYGNYLDQRDNVNDKVAVAIESAKKEQSEADDKKLVEAVKQPYTQLVGPDDLGRVTLSYPKTWSVYIAKDGTGGAYEAYLNPGSVPAVTSTQAYATRVVVSETSYESSIASYSSAVKKGDLRSTPITIGNFNGIKLEGKFSTTRSGQAVVFKVRDNTLTIATDSPEYATDFNEVVVKSLNFNP